MDMGIDQEKAILDKAVMGVCRVDPKRQGKTKKVVVWRIERGARRNYRHLGKRLARRNKALYRNGSSGHGLIHVTADGDTRLITKASQLAPVIVDTFTMKVMKEGKIVSELPQAGHLNAMLHAEAFLSQFCPVDQVARTALYLDDFTLVQPGYHDGGPRRRLLYLGPKPKLADSLETLDRFLGVMDFGSNADRTNTVAAALTILLRHRWPGEKPAVLITATKSHAGKGTITEFIRGAVPKADILYENIDWPMQNQLQKQVMANPEIGMISLDNVRLDTPVEGRSASVRRSPAAPSGLPPSECPTVALLRRPSGFAPRGSATVDNSRRAANR